MTKLITIYHGYDEDGRMVFPLGEESPTPAIAVRAYTYETEADHATIMETIFRENNAVDGSEYPVQFKTRSLSVGDFFSIDGSYYLVASFGFDEMALGGPFPAGVELVTPGEVRARQQALNRRQQELI